MKLILLDRDGVINEDVNTSVKSVEEFKLNKKSAQAIHLLNREGFKVVVITNQAVVGRGEISIEKLEEIHEHMTSQLKKHNAYLDEIIYCADAEASSRRKPAPGMLLEALKKYKAIPSETPFVGDTLRDLQAAEAAGCIPILVRSGKGKTTFQKGLPSSLIHTQVFDDLWYFAQTWVK